jgi:hypothetical protein
MIDPTARNRTLPADMARPGNPYEPFGSDWWLFRLNARLDADARRLTTLDRYYRGLNDTFRLASTAAIDSGIAHLFRGLNANLAKLVIDAASQRLVVYGFRLRDQRGDKEAWRIWQANDMDESSQIAHVESMVKRSCPILVEPNERDPSTPRITVQDPLNTIVETAPGDYRIRRAALKRWREDDGTMQMTLYLPDRIEKWRERRPGEIAGRTVRIHGGQAEMQATWVLRDMPMKTWSVAGLVVRQTPESPVKRNPIGEIPLVLIRNMPRVDGSCEAEHETVLPLFDLYNKTLLDMATSAEFGAFPQRYGIGVEGEDGEEPETEAARQKYAGTPLSRYRQAVDSMITTPSPDARFGQFPAVDLGNYVKALDHIRAAIGTISFTPYHLLLNMPTAVPATGEALYAAEVGLDARVEAHKVIKGNGWEGMTRLAFRLAGDETRAAATASETIWKDTRPRNISSHVQALREMRQELGLPLHAVWEKLPASPTEIERWEAWMLEEHKNLIGLVGEDLAQRTTARTISGRQPAEPVPPVPVAPEPGLDRLSR